MEIYQNNLSIELMVQFKIDLIVWKWAYKGIVFLKTLKFKIDLIVWKYL